MEEKVNNYSFRNFGKKEDVQNDDSYDYKLEDVKDLNSKIDAKILKIEREAATSKGFEVSPDVFKHRGLLAQKEREEKRRVENLVYHEVEQIREDAFKEGYEAGLEKGKEEIAESERVKVDKVVSDLDGLVTRFKEREGKIIEDQKVEVLTLIKNLTRWIILRELKDDGEYIDRLISKLVEEAEESSFLTFKVANNVYEEVKVSIEKMQESLAKDKTVDLSIDQNLKDNEVDLVTVNTKIKTDMNEQMRVLDSLFENVGVF